MGLPAIVPAPPRRPVFFLSYAREDGAFVAQFHAELSEALRGMIGGSINDIGFYDQSDIALGDSWGNTLVQALQNCQVFVPLYTPTYFTKPGCGKEWAVFRARQQMYAAQSGAPLPPLVIPILWGAKQDLPSPLPAELESLQFATGATGGDYIASGMQVLMKQSWRQPARDDAIFTIARRIKTVSEAHALPALQNPPAFDAATPLFPVTPVRPVVGAPGGAVVAPDPGQGGPRFVQVILVAASKAEVAGRKNQEYYGYDQLEWCPYLPTEKNRAGAIAMQVVGERNFLPELASSPLDNTLVAQLQDAERNNKIVVLLVDTWTLQIERYSTLMQNVDQGAYLNASVLVLWDGDNETAGSAEGLDRLVRATFYNRSHSNHARAFVSPVKSATEFRTELGEALEAARRRMRERADLMREVKFTARPTF